MRLAFACLLALAGCGDSSPANADAAADLSVAVDAGRDMALLSRCGHPGDTGNSIGVGLFCLTSSDCSGNSGATLCSSIVNGSTPSSTDSYFCLKLCAATDPPTVCGENAYCACTPQGCGCAPNRCRNFDLGVTD